MRPIIILLFLLVIGVVSGLQSSDATTTGQEKAKLKLIIPDDKWDPDYFKEINKRTKIAKLPKLRSIILPKDDLEARLWAGFSNWGIGGVVIKRSGGQWSAIHLGGIIPRLPESRYPTSLPAPKSGWEACWKRLEDQGLLTLPDMSELKGRRFISVDGTSYVVEINMNGRYRTYHYSEPNFQSWEEARQFVKISNIIDEEFGLPEFRIRETSP